MKNFRTIFRIMFVVVLVMILVQWAFYIFLGYNVLTDPEGSGEVVGKFLDGVNK